jgi:hypothetical protein
MHEIQPEIVISLRDMANRGIAPSQMLREVLQRFNLEEPRSGFLVWHWYEAFGFDATHVHSICGWYSIPLGIGELSDAQVDYFLGPFLKNADWPGKTATPTYANARPQAPNMEKST